jgi:hypothetical protein
VRATKVADPDDVTKGDEELVDEAVDPGVLNRPS